jgi:ribonuclease P protein component
VKRRYRLARSSDFRRVLRGGRLYSGRSLIAFAGPGAGPVNRVGVTTSRQVRGSVRRNRARRRLREVVRKQMLDQDLALEGGGISYDVVLIARPEALTLPFKVLEVDFARALSKIQARP